jgi:transketolase
MRAMPNGSVVVLADNVEVRRAIGAALRRDGPTYIRICRNPAPAPFEGAAPLETGRVRGLRDVSADLPEVSTAKPADEAALLESARKTGMVSTVEEPTAGGGPGGATVEIPGRRARQLAEGVAA